MAIRESPLGSNYPWIAPPFQYQRVRTPLEALAAHAGQVADGYRYVTSASGVSGDSRSEFRAQKAWKAKATRWTFQMALQNAEYAAAHGRAMDTFCDFETRAETALADVRDTIGRETPIFEEMQERGTRLPDKRVVFRDEQGRARTPGYY